MLHLSTKKKIALTTACILTSALVVFGALMNVIFYQYWYQQALTRLEDSWHLSSIDPFTLQDHFRDVIHLDVDHTLAQEILGHQLWGSIHTLESGYYVHAVRDGQIAIIEVTDSVESQMRLLWSTLIMSVLLGVLSFFLVRWYVNKQFSALTQMATELSHMNIDDLSYSLHIDSLPDHDEVRIVHDAVQYMTQQLRKQILIIKEFVAHVSHELRTPLTVLQGRTELALETKKYRDALESNLATAKELTDILSTMIALTKKPSEKEFCLECIDMYVLVQHIQDLVRHKYQYKGVQRELVLQKDVHCHTHRSSMHMLIRNLIDNACKYTPEGGYVRIELQENVVRIYDQGPGISQDQQERMREPFWQANKHSSGVGLGLSLVQKICEVFAYDISYTYCVPANMESVDQQAPQYTSLFTLLWK